MGRMGALTAGMGTYDVFQWLGDTFDGGWNYAVNVNNWFERAHCDNMLTLVTPTYAGLTSFVDELRKKHYPSSVRLQPKQIADNHSTKFKTEAALSPCRRTKGFRAIFL